MKDLICTPIFNFGARNYKPDYSRTINEDGTSRIECIVPHEVLHFNSFNVSMFGSDPTTKVIRINFPWWEVPVKKGCNDDGGPSSDPSLTVYEKVLRDIQDIQSKIVDPDKLSAAIAQYFVDNPIKTLTEKDVEPWIATYVTNNKSTLKGDTGAAGQNGVDGATGPQGPKGDTGLTGADGPKGDTGAIGPQGPKGDIGAKGADGTAGKDGADGYSPSAKVEQTSTGATITITDKTGTTSATVKNGTNGTNGKDGTNGTNGTNGVSVSSVSQTATSTADGGTNVITVTLSDGTKSTCNVLNGTKGSKGDTGAAGSAGTNGKSAYELAVAGGYTGTQTEWIASLKGEKGDTGAVGPKGDTGAIGAIGPQGPKGDTGEIGPQGPAGADGKDGKDMTAQGETVTDTGAVTKALTANRFCNFTGAVTTLTITLPTTYNPWDEFSFTFTTDNAGGNLAVPNTIKWLSGSAPTLAASTHYEVSIVDDWAVIAP